MRASSPRCDHVQRERQRLRIVGKRLSVVAMDVVRKLVQHHDQRQPAARAVVPAIEFAPACGDEGFGKTLGDQLIVGSRFAEPELALPRRNICRRARRAEPEIEHRFGRGDHERLRKCRRAGCCGCRRKRLVRRVLAVAQPYGGLFLDDERYRLQPGAFVRAIAKRLGHRASARAPPVFTRFEFEFGGRAVIDDGFGHGGYQ